MDTRLIVIISSLAVLSSATTSTDTITSTVPGNGGGSVPAISSISQATLNPSSLPSTSTTSHTANPSPSPQVSTNLTLAPTISISMPDKTSNASQLNNPTNHTMSTTTTHSSNITSSSVLEENTTQDPSGTTEPPVNDPHTTIEPSTKIQCNCSEYVTPSPVTKKPQTSTKSPNITTTPPASMSPSPTTKATPPTTTEPSASMSPSQTTKATLPSSTTKAPSSITKAASSITKAPSSITKAPSSITKATSSITKAPSSITKAPASITKAPVSITKAPASITKAPSSITKATSSTTKAPASITKALSLTNKASSPITKAPSSTTKAPSPITSAPSSITKAPSPITSAPSSITKAPSPITKAPSSTTKATSSTTKAPASITKAPASITKAPSSITKATPSTTKAPASITKAPSSTTKATSSTTKAPASITKAPASITKAPSTTPNATSRTNDEIQSEEQSILYDDTNTVDLYCMNLCYMTMNETTTEPPLTTTTERPTTTTPKPTTTTPRHRSIDLSGKLVDWNLVIVVKGNFTQDLNNTNTTVYKNLANQFRFSLNQFYRRLLPAKFKKIVILGFSNGSIKCNYLLEMNAPINESNANSTLQILRNVNWTTDSLANLTLDVNKTTTAQAALSSNDLVFLPPNVCVNNEVLEWDDDGNPICKYKCDTPAYKGKCGDHGECSFTYGGVFRCICKDGYSARGNNCETPKPTTTTAKPIKPDDIALSKIDIIGIAGGIGGGLVLILLVALCCVYTKLNKAKKRDRFYGYMDNDKEFLHDENSRIENVPDLKNEYTNLGYQTEQNELQMQRFEPEGKNVEYEPGQRQGAYERDDKAYRQVEEPEGGNVLIYQPKHLNGPMERQSGASKFDEVEERSNPYRMMDTDTTYKIRRPTVNSDRNVPYN